MKVYLVYGEWDYGVSRVLSVHKTESGAELALEKNKAEWDKLNHFAYDDYYVQEQELLD